MKCMKMRQDFGRRNAVVSSAWPSFWLSRASWILNFPSFHYFIFFESMASSRCCKTVLVSSPSSKKDSFCPPASARVVPCVNLQSGWGGSLPLHAVYRGTWHPIPCAPFPYLQSGLNSCLLPPVGTSRRWWKQCPWSCWSFFRKALKYKFLLAMLSYRYLQIQLE